MFWQQPNLNSSIGNKSKSSKTSFPKAPRQSNFLEILDTFNTHEKETTGQPADIKAFLRKMLSDDDDDTLSSFESLFQIGGAMFLLGSHYCVIKTLLMNPDWYAENSVDNVEELKEFKKVATVQGLRKMLTDACCANASGRRKSHAKKNLLSLLDSDDNDDNETVVADKRKNREKKPISCRLPTMTYL